MALMEVNGEAMPRGLALCGDRVLEQPVLDELREAPPTALDRASDGPSADRWRS
jgi:hypothetical protein